MIKNELMRAIKLNKKEEYFKVVFLLENLITKKNIKQNIKLRIYFELIKAYLNIIDVSFDNSKLLFINSYFKEIEVILLKKALHFDIALNYSNWANFNYFVYKVTKDQNYLKRCIDDYQKAVMCYNNKLIESNLLSEHFGRNIKLNEEFVLLYKADTYYSYAYVIGHNNFQYLLDNRNSIEIMEDCVVVLEYLKKITLQDKVLLDAKHKLGNLHHYLWRLTKNKKYYQLAIVEYEEAIKFYLTSDEDFNKDYHYLDDLVDELKKMKDDEVKEEISRKFYEEKFFNVRNCCECKKYFEASQFIISSSFCEECKGNYLKLRVPKNIWIFIIIVCCVFIFSLSKIPTSKLLAQNYNQALMLLEQRKCEDAYKKISSIDYKGKKSQLYNETLFIILIKTMRYQEAKYLFEERLDLKNISIDNIKEITKYYYVIFDNEKQKIDQIVYNANGSMLDLSTLLEKYNTVYPKSITGKFYLAHVKSRLGEFNASIKLIKLGLKQEPYNDFQRLKLAYIYWNVGKYELSNEECSYILKKRNSQNDLALSYYSRNLIKLKKFEDALKYAKEAYNIDMNDPYNIQTLSFVSYFNNDLAGKERYYRILKNLKYDEKKKKEDLKFLNDIFEGRSLYYSF